MGHELIERISCDRCTEVNEEPVPKLHEGGLESTATPAGWGLMRDTDDGGFMLCPACIDALGVWILNNGPKTEHCDACAKDFVYLERHKKKMHPLVKVTTHPPSTDAKVAS